MVPECFTQELGSKPLTVRSKSESEIVIEVNKETQIITILSIKKLNNVDVCIAECASINQSKGLMYFYDHNLPDSGFEK